MERCLFCGKESNVNEQGVCPECAKQLHNKPLPPIDAPKSPYEQNPFQVAKFHCKLTVNRVAKKFDSFYKFFHFTSIATGITVLVGWIIYFLWEFADSGARKSIATESFASGAKNINYVPFTPRWEIPLTAILIIIFGLLLSYICEAIGKYFELKD